MPGFKRGKRAGSVLMLGEFVSGKHAAVTTTVLAVSAAAVPAAMVAGMTATAPAIVPAAAGHDGPAAAVLMARITPPQAEVSTARATRQVALRSYTVKGGDTLSGIAGQFCGNAGKWPSLYHGNHGTIGADPDLILPGQKLTMSCGDPSLLPAASAAVKTAADQAPAGGKVWGVAYGYPNYCGDGDGDGWDVACASPVTSQPAVQQHAAVQHVAQATAQVTGASGTLGAYPGGAFGACVVARESGGNAQVMNSSGHYGLYQFAESTWEEYGGSAADFGHASAAEQERVFSNALAAGGQSNWSPYDGC